MPSGELQQYALTDIHRRMAQALSAWLLAQYPELVGGERERRGGLRMDDLRNDVPRLKTSCGGTFEDRRL